MMPLPPFELIQPQSIQEAVEALAKAGERGRVLAGGTDLLVNMKHHLHPGTSEVLVHIGDLPELRGVEITEDHLYIGAGERLSDLASHPLVLQHAPSVATAVGKVAHPQARNMGTIGGNICLDVRCQYVNRTPTWRDALGGCIKSEGDLCHVVPKGTRCVAALSGDSVPPLVTLDAEVRIVHPGGERWLPISELRDKDGTQPLKLGHGELVVGIRIPLGPSDRLSAYHKWAVRQAVDFPLVSFAMVCDRDTDGTINAFKIAVGVLGPRPKSIKGLNKFVGRQLSPDLANDVAALVRKQCAPLTNVLYDVGYRRHLLQILVRRQLEAWLTGDAKTLNPQQLYVV
jgi:4-hydroxybenzoyl-CoA reductase subunit beta